MEISWGVVVMAAIAQFVVGAIWYMPIFGKIWGKIHGFDTLSAVEQAEAQKQMLPLLAIQFLMGAITSWALVVILELAPEGFGPYTVAGFLWLGFIFPVEVGAILFGGTKSNWILTKVMVSSGGALACLLAATAVVQIV